MIIDFSIQSDNSNLFIVFAIAGVVCFAGGALTKNAGRRAARTSVLELYKLDKRAPILFLRAFGDDQVRLAPPKLSFLGYCYDLGQRESNLDALVLEEGTDYGPVVALGNPKDPMPPYGAARGYFHDEDWQSAVARLAEASSAIIICLDDTEGVWWEVDHIAANNMLQEKTLFLIHPRYSAITENQNILHKVAQRLALSDDFAQARSPQESVIGFFIDGNHSLKVAYSNTFSRVAFLMIMRWFVRTRFTARVVNKITVTGPRIAIPAVPKEASGEQPAAMRCCAIAATALPSMTTTWPMSLASLVSV